LREGAAHGHQCLSIALKSTITLSEFYTPAVEGVLMYNDPKLRLEWPLPVRSISRKDSQWKLLDQIEVEIQRRMTLTG
jgi:dTDP-4-dehydrorhamnose 3,5-epimerase